MKNKQTEKEIWRIIKKYTPILFLQQYDIEVEYGTKNETSLCECTCAYPYFNNGIKYSNALVALVKQHKSIEKFVVHELCHPITDPLYCKATTLFVSKNEIEDERERLTDLICNIVLNL